MTPKGTKSTLSAADDELTFAETVDLDDGSAPWVAWLMFGGLALGTLVIFVNYLILSDPSNWWLLSGLVLVLVGIVAATRYR